MKGIEKIRHENIPVGLRVGFPICIERSRVEQFTINPQNHDQEKEIYFVFCVPLAKKVFCLKKEIFRR